MSGYGRAVKWSDLPADVRALASQDWAAQSPVVPLPGWFEGDDEAWLSRHNAYCAQARAGAGTRVLFIGDSITEGWGHPEQAEVWAKHFAPLPALNFGIGGDRTQQLLWRIDHGTLEGLDPELVVLLIGVNNLWAMRHSADEVAEGVKLVVDRLLTRLPRAKVLHQGILPTAEEPDNPLRVLAYAVNDRLAQFDFGTRVRYVDLRELFLEPDGRISPEVMPDFCHLSTPAYARWAQALDGPISQMLG